MRLRTIRFALLLALFIPAVGCSSGSQCDRCETSADCDEGQNCLDSTLGRRCFLEGDNTCEIGVF